MQKKIWCPRTLVQIFYRALLLTCLALGAFRSARAAVPVAAVLPPDGVRIIEGWSAGSELEPTHRDGTAPVVLEPGHLDLVLFFRSVKGRQVPSLFRYRLQGLFNDWTETRQGVVHFRRLPPGEYRFEVQAALADGSWPLSATTLQIEQKPFFYQTWYAGVMVCAFVVAVGVQLLRQRDQLLKGQLGVVLEERNRIASECHDTLMAGFAAVSWQLEATAGLLDADAPQEHATASSLELARSMVSHCQAEARRIIWDLRNSDRITTKLSEALADAIDAHRLRDGAETTLLVHGDEVILSPAAVHHLTCIGQEALTNAMRHARPSLIQVQLQFEADSLCLTVRDDGCGFAAQDGQSKSGHFGIPVMEERTRKLGGQFRLTSSSAKGTEVAVTVHFNGIHQPIVKQATVIPWIGL